MKYRIVITAFEENPNYAKDMEAYDRQRGYSNGFGGQPTPHAEREVKKLETVLAEAQFNAARAAILGAM